MKENPRSKVKIYLTKLSRDRAERVILSALMGLNKAENTATPVACGWAGAMLRSLDHLGWSSEAKDCKIIKK